MQMSESIVDIAKAMSAFQSEIKHPDKAAYNKFFDSKYVPLNKVISAFKEFGPKHGLSFIQYPVNGEKSIGVETLLLHTSGEFIKFDPYFLPLDKQTPQGAGSCITYAKRYALSAALGIDSDEDDDGNQASQTSGNSQQQGKPQGSQGNVSDIKSHTASGKQIGLIKGLWKGSGGDSKQLEQYTSKKYGKQLDKLTSREASELITKLKNRQNKKDEPKKEPQNNDPFPEINESDMPF
jgi:hypothetical protein